MPYKTVQYAPFFYCLKTCPRLSLMNNAILPFAGRGGDAMLKKKSLTDTQILEELSLLAVDKDIAANYRIKALELLGKANNLFGDNINEVIKAVKIVDDVP